MMEEVDWVLCVIILEKVNTIVDLILLYKCLVCIFLYGVLIQFCFCFDFKFLRLHDMYDLISILRDIQTCMLCP